MALTIYDLARAAGVSIATVSKALSDSHSVSEETKQRIRALAKEMNYQPNARARNFARQKNGAVLFAADLSRGIGFHNPHLFEIITGAARYLDEKGYALLLKHVETQSAPKTIAGLMQSEQADGVMVHAGILTRPLASMLVKEAMPHLIIGKPSFPCSLSWMDISHEAAGQLAANYLLDKGYRRMVFLMGNPQEDAISARRLSGLLTVLEDEELTIETIQGVSTYADGREQTQRMIARAEKPEVILCASNHLALGCLESLRDAHVRIPQDIALMTFDNYPSATVGSPRLTAIEMDMFEIGWEAARSMLQMIRRPNLQTQAYCTAPVLVEGEST